LSFGERAGSGIFNLVTLWNQAGWEKPVLEENFDAERTTLIVPVELTKTVENELDTVEENPEKFGENPEKFGENPEKFGENPEKFGENPEKFGENPEKFGENPEKFGENPEKFGENPEKFGENPEKFGENPEKSSEKILNAIRKNPQITIKELSEWTQITTRAIEKTISKLKSVGFLERVGSDKGGYWKVFDDDNT
jgi:predicted HTH transcriptional regulator